MFLQAYDYQDAVIEEIGEKISQSHHSILYSLTYLLAMALLSAGLFAGFKSIRNRTFLYRLDNCCN